VTEVNIDGCIFKVYEANDFSLFLSFVTYFLEAHIPITWQAIWILRLASLCFAAPWVMNGGQELVKLWVNWCHWKVIGLEPNPGNITYNNIYVVNGLWTLSEFCDKNLKKRRRKRMRTSVMNNFFPPSLISNLQQVLTAQMKLELHLYVRLALKGMQRVVMIIIGRKICTDKLFDLACMHEDLD